MKKIELKIAGTSVGGSSYTRRLMSAIREANGARIDVVIGGGEKQFVVFSTVTEHLLELSDFVTERGGKAINNVRMGKE